MGKDGGQAAWCEEVRRVYPHRVSISAPMWRSFFGEAVREIGILTDDGRFLANDSVLLRLLAERASAGVRVRIMVVSPTGWEALAQADGVQLGVHQAVLGNAVYRSDDQLLVHQYIHGVPAPAAPVLHLRKAGNGDLHRSYLEGFERVWLECVPATDREEVTFRQRGG
jgi:hypothetical protein